MIFDRWRAKSTASRSQAKAAQVAFVEFAATHPGTQAWVEQASGFNKASLLLVAGDGEWLRRTVPDIDWARRFAQDAKLTCFAAGIDPYPQRMRDWDAAHRPPRKA